MHLRRAEERVLEASQEFAPVRNLLKQSRAQAPMFAEKALGWSSKWRIAVDAVPFTKGNRNETFLREQFEQIVLRGPDLEKAVEQCVSEFLKSVQSIESRMLVDLRADIANLGAQNCLVSLGDEELQSQFDIAIEKAMRLASGDLQANISSQLVSLVVGEVLTQVAVRLGVSAGILGTGAATGWATLGIGVVVGIVIDQIVMTIWSKWSDPKGQLSNTISHQLSIVEDLICLGDKQTKGLAKHFEEIANARSSIRQRVLFELLDLKDSLVSEGKDTAVVTSEE